MCLHYAIINAAQRIGGKIEKFEFYRQCLPRRVKDTDIKELEIFEFVSSVMTIAPVLNTDRSKMGTLGILLRIYDGVYVCNFTIYSYTLKQFTQHAFFHDSHFSTKEKSEFYGAIIDNISYSPICVPKEKDIKVNIH